MKITSMSRSRFRFRPITVTPAFVSVIVRDVERDWVGRLHERPREVVVLLSSLITVVQKFAASSCSSGAAGSWADCFDLLGHELVEPVRHSGHVETGGIVVTTVAEDQPEVRQHLAVEQLLDSRFFLMSEKSIGLLMISR